MLTHLRNVFASLNSHDVRYVVIGGVAAIVHGVPRMTFDLDLLIDPTRENAERLLQALEEAGLGTATLINPDALLENEITVLKDLVRIDIQTATPGIEFADVWGRKQKLERGELTFYVLSKQDLIAAKRASGRRIDLEDVDALESGESD